MDRLNKLAVLAGLTALVSVGCGGTGEPAPPLVEEDPGLTMSFSTGEYEIPTGDVFMCFYTDTFAAEELAVVRALGAQSLGGHHITVYYTESPQEPQHHLCDDEEMLSWNQVAGAAIDPDEFVLDVPEGLGMRVPEGAQMVIQAHYINTTGEPMMVKDDVTLTLARPEDLIGYVNDFVVLDTGFSVAPHSDGESVTTCTVQEDLEVVRLLGHAHEWGSYFKLEEIDEQGEVVEVLYDEVWSPEYSSAPPLNSYTMEEPLVLKSGMRLRQTCRWENNEDYALEFPREMCLTYAIYFPDDGRKFCAMD